MSEIVTLYRVKIALKQGKILRFSESKIERGVSGYRLGLKRDKYEKTIATKL